jgi:hypothetical protein
MINFDELLQLHAQHRNDRTAIVLRGNTSRFEKYFLSVTTRDLFSKLK